jgi:nucleoside-diphosphate-sugar epimerase
MHVIIFGATGAVGQHVARTAVEQHHDVTLFVRSKIKLWGVLPDVLQKCKCKVTCDRSCTMQHFASSLHGEAADVHFQAPSRPRR